MTAPIIRAEGGLGSRVTTIANSLGAYGVARIHWPINADMPADHDVLFPNGIDGVEFVVDPDGSTRRIVRAENTVGRMAHLWDLAGVDFYARIMAVMIGEAGAVFPLAVIARFLRRGAETPTALVARIVSHAPVGPVFIMADSRRGEMGGLLALAGVEAAFGRCREIARDLDRLPGDYEAFCSDWKTASSAHALLAMPEKTTLAHPWNAAIA